MKLVHSKCEIPFIDDNYFSVVSVEAPSFYSELVREVHRQGEGLDGLFCLSDEGREISFSKYVDFQMDPFSLPFNERRMLNRLQANLNNQAVEEGLDFEVAKITRSLYDMLEVLVVRESYASLEKNSIELGDLLKLFGLRFAIDYDCDLLRSVFDYVLTAIKFSDSRLFIFVGLSPYLSNEDINELALFSQREEAMILLLDGELKRLEKPIYGTLIVIDEDLCEIC